MFSREASSLGFAADPCCILAADSVCIASQNLNDGSNDPAKHTKSFFFSNNREVFTASLLGRLSAKIRSFVFLH